jgi:FixJ family two-component response regulator
VLFEGSSVVHRQQIVGIIEDDTSMLRSLARLLGARGFVTEVYSSAEAYLREAADSKATCLIIDIQLGGISGIELRHRLARSGSPLSIVFMTATDDVTIRNDAIAAGCLAFLRKPFPARDLLEALERAPNGH